MDLNGILRFLAALKRNNNREWFEKNKPIYLEAKNAFDDFLELFHREVVKFDPRLAGLNPRKQAFRIYRDVRFSKDKRPYKVNMGAGFSPGGKMEQEPGYYLHVEPGNCFVAAGIYMPNSGNLAKIRQEIDYNPEKLKKMMAARSLKKFFAGFDDFDKVKTAPKGYPKDHPQIDLLKHKSFIVSHAFTDAEVKMPTYFKKVAEVCRAAKPLNDYLNEALA